MKGQKSLFELQLGSVKLSMEDERIMESTMPAPPRGMGLRNATMSGVATNRISLYRVLLSLIMRTFAG